ncbi:MAG: hypothetical protein RL171_1979 [Pseudomonadota bacterium]
MQKKFIILLVAAIAGVGVGALLGFGPMLRYKSEAVLNMDMGTSEYKRFTELANNTSSARQFLAVFPPPQMHSGGIDSLMSAVAKGEWHKALPKVSKVDAKEVPDAVLQMERDSEKEKEKEKEKVQGKNGTKNFKENAVYLGLRLTHTASDPLEAAEMTTWLGGYFKEVATREAVREQVSHWTADNRQFSDRALEQKLKYEFDIEQAKNRALALKKIVALYPDTSSRESRQVIDVRKDNEKFMSPLAKLVGAESELIEIGEKTQQLNREIEQQAFAGGLLKEAELALKQARSGSESVSKLAAVIADYSKKVKTDAEREKLLSLAADLSQISARFMSQAQFIAQPSVPSRPERPTPLMYMVLMGGLFGALAALYIWRTAIINLLKQDTQDSN